jgi:hypothetical protein
VGSVAAVLSGGEPAETDPGKQEPGPPCADQALAAVLHSDLPDRQKQRIVALLDEQRETTDRIRLAYVEEMLRLARGE